MSKPVWTYSSGMYVRLAFAVSACVDPEVFIVDEALAVGDVRFQAKCFRRLDELLARGCAVVLVTHDPEQVTPPLHPGPWCWTVARSSSKARPARWLTATWT